MEGKYIVLMFNTIYQVDIHVMKEPPSGEWTFLATELTDKSGRITYKVYIEFYNFILYTFQTLLKFVTF